jgi:AcrR family transcriptional regulator
MALETLTKTAAELLGAPPPARGARDRLIHKAIDLFYRHGFNAVGLDRVLDEVGVTKTTFYKHFESKDDLMVQALRQRDEWEMQSWNRAVKQIAGDDPRAQLLGLLDVLDLWFNDPMYGGCIFINAAAEFPDPNDPVHKVAAEHKRKARDGFRDLAQAAGAEDPETFADRYAMLFEGTLIMRHVYHRNDAARMAKTMAQKLLEEFIPTKPSPDRSTPRRARRPRRTKQQPAPA